MHRSRHGVIAALLALLSCSDSAVLAQVYLTGRAGLSASSNVTVRSAGKAALTYAIPGTDRDRIALNTMRGWLSRYRTGDFEALYPKRRADRGRTRRLPESVVQRLVELSEKTSPQR